jgi:hypothetical protein
MLVSPAFAGAATCPGVQNNAGGEEEVMALATHWRWRPRER